jgi:hypothetical protein
MNAERKKRLFGLFTAHAADALTPDEHEELQQWLRDEAEARQLWFVHQDIEMGLQAHLVAAPANVIELASAIRWWNWRPLTAAAAGLAIGLFSASLVFGLVTPWPPSTQTLLTEGFEDVEMVRDRGLPVRVGVWSGDLLAPQDAEGNVKPAEGLRMVKLPPDVRRMFSYTSRFLDVTAFPPMGASQSRQIEVTARFHGATPGVSDRFQIRLAAFAEDIAGARAIWIGGVVNEQALIHVAKTVTMDADTRGWTTLRSTMDVPAGARLLLISLAAAAADAEGPKTAHYLDDVQVRLITGEAPPASPRN